MKTAHLKRWLIFDWEFLPIFFLSLSCLMGSQARAQGISEGPKTTLIKDFKLGAFKWNVTTFGNKKLVTDISELNSMMKNEWSLGVLNGEPILCKLSLTGNQFQNSAPGEGYVESLKISCKYHGVEFSPPDTTCSKEKGGAQNTAYPSSIFATEIESQKRLGVFAICFRADKK